MASLRTDIDPRATGVAVKICGITRPDLALAAADLRVDMIGLVFAPSRRQASPETARSIRLALAEHEDRMGVRPMVVGVFVNEPAQGVVSIAREVGLDIVQLSGDETPEEVARCAERYPVIKAFRFAGAVSREEALEALDAYDMHASNHRVRPLVDAHIPGVYGGTGQVADWPLAAALAERYPVILAGGLTPENVTAAISSVLPWGVDVSSGVESDGIKDPRLMEMFVRAVYRPPLRSYPSTPLPQGERGVYSDF